MLEHLRNLRTSELTLRQPLSPLECDWLTGCLRARNGIATVNWGDKACRLFVEHDPEIVGSPELVDFLRSCGVPVTPARTHDAKM
jgi:hypothetical protein